MAQPWDLRFMNLHGGYGDEVRIRRSCGSMSLYSRIALSTAPPSLPVVLVRASMVLGTDEASGVTEVSGETNGGVGVISHGG
jgi:hypothetical protein